MAITVDQPETISRAAFLATIESLGLNPQHVMSLEFRREGVYAVVHALNDEGRIYTDGDEVATHRVFIRVVDE